MNSKKRGRNDQADIKEEEDLGPENLPAIQMKRQLRQGRGPSFESLNAN